jgi:hypothetical protein
MERNWYFAVGGVRSGPVTVEELQAAVRDGRLGPEDLVWQPEFGPQWCRVREVPALAASSAAPQPPPFAASAGNDNVPLMDVVGERPSCLRAVAQAFDRTMNLLFRPFDLGRWFSIGFCAWLAYIGTQSLYDFSESRKDGAAAFKQTIDTSLDRVQALAAHPTQMAAYAGLGLLLLLFSLWLCSVRSRGDFMFVHRWYCPDATIRQCWESSREPGHALFLWRVGFFVVSAVLFAAVGYYLFGNVIHPYVLGGKVWDAAFARPLAVSIAVVVLLVIVVDVVAFLAKSFVVPVMYWRGVTAPRAWWSVFALCNQYPFAVVSYVLCAFGCAVLATLAVIVAGLLTCCIGFVPLLLPYLGQVVLLPIFLFFRGYSVCFLNQWRPDLVPSER